MGDLEFFLLLLLGATALVRIADAIAVPYAIVLVLAGLAVGFVPNLPDLQLDPDVTFLVFLPPLLSAAGYYASPQELREEARALRFLTIGLVLLTMGAVAVVAHAVIPGLDWAAAFVLGAVVAPTDPVAAAATFARMGVPDRVALLVEGEAMINDATALVAFRIAVTAAVSGSFSAGDALVDFIASAAGGIAIGLAAGWLQVEALRRLDDRPLSILLTVLTPYGAYIAAEEAGLSGVLAAVLCGLYLGWHAHRATDADTRLSAQAFWEVLVFTLNASIFVLLGVQFPGLLDDLRAQESLGELAWGAALVSATVVAVRMASQFLPGAGTGGGRRERVAIGWSGMRGAISLAAALAVPLSVEGRPQILFVTVVVILVTLVGQGLTLPAVLRALRLSGDRPWSPEEAIARLEAAQAALDRIDELENEDPGAASGERLRRLRELYRARFRQCQAVLGGESPGKAAAEDRRMRYSDLRRELIDVERTTLIALRDEGRLRPDTLRVIQRDLDLEEARLGAA